MNVLQTQSTTIKSELNQASAMTGGLGAFGVSTPSVTLTIRLIMQGKEVGSIIGKKGDNIKRFREESGAKITISDGSCPERIVTVTGSTDSILKAFALIAHKFEEVSNDPTNFTSMSHSQMNLTGNGQNGKSNCSIGSSGGSSPVSLKLIVPASQCGSLIGKGGSKIKEIRESTGASIQVASEMLPNSTERAVTLSGSADSITKSIYQICCVMLESPPKGPTIPYRPKPAMPPVFFAGGQAYTIQGQFAIPHPDLTKLHRLALQHAPLLPQQAGIGSLSPQAATLASLANSAASMGHHTPTAANAGVVATVTTEMTIPNDVIGSIIGKGGAKINEIRQLSGATIKINNCEEGTKDRVVIVSGTPEAINLAQYLIATRIIQSDHNLSMYQPQMKTSGNECLTTLATDAATSSTPSSSDSMNNDISIASYGNQPQQQHQQQQQHLQYALMYKNYVQQYNMPQYSSDTIGSNSTTLLPSNYYTNTNGTGMATNSFINGNSSVGSSNSSESNSSHDHSNTRSFNSSIQLYKSSSSVPASLTPGMVSMGSHTDDQSTITQYGNHHNYRYWQ